MTRELTFSVKINSNYEDSLQKLKAALQAEGFGVLTEIDVRTTMKAKLDIDYKPMIILGACNPMLGHKILSADHKAGALLPCNVTLEEQDDGCLATFVDPLVVLNLPPLDTNKDIQAVAAAAEEKLRAAANALRV